MMAVDCVRQRAGEKEEKGVYSMTREENICQSCIHSKVCKSNDGPCEYCNQYLVLTALRPVSREQVEKVWRGYWEQGDIYDYGDVCSKCQYDSGRELCKLNFCPRCGAPMTDEAVEMVMERLEALHDNRT